MVHRLVFLLLLVFCVSCAVSIEDDKQSIMQIDDIYEDSDNSDSLNSNDKIDFEIQGDVWSGIIHNPRAEVEGAWSEIFDWPLVTINTALLPDGSVFTFGTKPKPIFDGNGRSFYHDVWSPKLGLGLDAHTTLSNVIPTNIFCSGQTLLINGELLITGGDQTADGQIETADDKVINNAGVQDINIYNYRSSVMTTSPIEMTEGRWYPTMTTLSNGDVLVQGGINAIREPNDTPEIWTSEKNWRVLSGATSPNYRESWSYPYSFLAPNGKVFVAGKGRNMWYIDPRNNGSVTRAGVRDGLVRFQGTAVMYDIGKILVIGGGNIPTDTVIEIDINGTTPLVKAADDMSIARKFLNATLLADGQVFVNGGSSGDGPSKVETAIYHGELWNPASKTWRRTSSAQRTRMYHSTSLLLPNGAVLTSGGDKPDAARNFNAEIYYPPYLFKKDGSGDFASRPTLTALSEVSYNQAFMATVGENTNVSRVTLVRFGSVTHGFNMDQRFLELEFNQFENRLTIEAPEKPELAPPGYYMLFVFDENGVPSEASTIYFKPLNN